MCCCCCRCFVQSMTFILMCMPELHVTISDEVVQWQYFSIFVLDLALTILNLSHPWEDTLKMQVLSIAHVYSSVLSDKNEVSHACVNIAFSVDPLGCWCSALFLVLCFYEPYVICIPGILIEYFHLKGIFFSIFILFKTAQAFIWRKILQ